MCAVSGPGCAVFDEFAGVFTGCHGVYHRKHGVFAAKVGEISEFSQQNCDYRENLHQLSAQRRANPRL